LSSGLQLQSVSFAELPDWDRERQGEALSAFRLSCAKLMQMPADAPIGPNGFAGRASDWHSACGAAGDIDALADDTARLLFQRKFRAYRLSDAKSGDQGLLPGYYRPLVAGSRQRVPGFDVPLYRRPPDLISQNGAVGRMVAGALQPYYTRAEIDDGALANRGLELVWLASPIDAFFVSVQGSAEIALADGGHMRIGVAANNGLGYVAIGRVLVAEGELKPED